MRPSPLRSMILNCRRKLSIVASFQPGTSVSGPKVECSLLASLNFFFASSTLILAWMRRFHLACWISAYPVPVK